ncbi:MAG: DHHA1 domain-containing protein [archaeon]|jgi:single-stranded DNA-specific DHH superfamily exonuclease|nr:DHHA1 domain-containing protein [archaeon]
MAEIKFLTGSEKRFFDFISKLNDKDKIALISHNDSDGITSAVISAKVLGKIDYLKFTTYNPESLSAIAAEIKEKKINKVIITDLSIDETNLLEMAKFADVLIIDHHVFRSDMNSDKVVYLKSPSELPASYMCHYLFSKTQEIPGWIAALGIASDRVDRYHNANVCEVFEDFSLGKISKCEYFWRTVMNLGYALIYYAGDEKKIFDIIMKAKDFDDLKEIEKPAGEVEREFEATMKDVEKNHEEFKDMWIYRYKPKYEINSMLANAVSNWDEKKTFVILSEGGDWFRVSARRQDRRVNCVKLLENAVLGIPGARSGGHFMAAGGNVPAKSIEQFKKNLLDYYSKLTIL